MVVLGSMADREMIVRPDGSMIVPVVSLFTSVFESSPPDDIPCLMTTFTVTTAFLYFSRTCLPATALSSAKQETAHKVSRTTVMVPPANRRHGAPKVRHSLAQGNALGIHGGEID